MNMIKSMGPLDGILGMLPGMRNLKKQIPTDLFDDKRRKRIANGSGNSVLEVNKLLKNFANMKKMMGSKGKMKKMMQALGGGSEGMPGMPDMGDLSDMDLDKMLAEGPPTSGKAKKGMPQGGLRLVKDKNDWSNIRERIAISGDLSDERYKDYPFSNILSHYRIAHTGVLTTGDPYELTRVHQNGSCMIATLEGEGKVFVDGFHLGKISRR